MATDNNQSAQQTDKVSKIAPVENAQTGHNVWQEAYQSTPATGPIGSLASSVEKFVARTDKPCHPSPSYLKFIDIALSESYSPEAFGDRNKVRHEFDCQISTQKDAVFYASQVLKRSGDSHTRILSKSENQSLANQSDPSFIGLGLEASFDARNSTPGHEHGVAVYRTYPDSPATQAGLKIGDEILSVDSQDVTKLSFAEASAKLEGPVGSTAHLWVDRNGEKIQIDAVRKFYNSPSVSDVSLPDNLAYICIEDFRNAHLADQLRDALLRHKDAKGFIIDLRGNGGGNVDLANLALSEVMKDGVIMKVRERNVNDTDQVSYLSGSYELTPKGIVLTEKSENDNNTFKIGNTDQVVTFDNDPESIKEVKSRMQNLVGDRPVVVLTDGGTASAAEIFTGAERETGKARTNGTTTFGKGIGGLYTSEQLPLDSGEIVTNMRWFTPSGFWAGDAGQHRYGLKPDIESVNPYGAIPLTAADVQLKSAEADLKNTLRKRNG
ncbi:MAG: S41 family peptidase [Candidatus Obscuribacterales bacterium]|nr:S41 family peptidase [Candidatus Obscuribacterales bacterium]